MGTPSYMAPEQAAGLVQQVGPAADVYALGAILYRTLTGRPPFRADSVTETLRRVVHEEPLRPRTINRQIPRPLELVCLKCLSKRVQDRYATAAQLAAELHRHLNGEPVQARPVRRLGLDSKWSSRLVISAAVVTLIGLVVAMIWPASRQADAPSGQAPASGLDERRIGGAGQASALPTMKVAAQITVGFKPRKLADVVDTDTAKVWYTDDFDDPKTSAFGHSGHHRFFVNGLYTAEGLGDGSWGTTEHRFNDFACELVGRTTRAKHRGWGVALFNVPDPGRPWDEVLHGVEVQLNSEGSLFIVPSRWIKRTEPAGASIEPLMVSNFRPWEFNSLVVVLQDGNRLSVFVNSFEACSPMVLPYKMVPAYVQIAHFGGSTSNAKLELESFRVLSTVERRQQAGK